MWMDRFGGVEPNYQAAGSMAAMVMLGASLSLITPGTTIDEVEIKKQLGGVFTNSFYGRLTTNKWGMNDRRAISVYQYDKLADVQLVAPLSAATARVNYPVPTLDSDDRNAPCGPGKKVIGANRMCSSAERAARAASTTETWGLLGDLWCETQCEPCPPGTFSDDATGSTECIPCPNNTVAGKSGSVACSACPAGKTHNADRTACADCAPGSAREADGIRCEPCGPGTFASMPGTSSCLSCDFDEGGYAVSYNNTECTACPMHSKRVLGSPGISVSECLCQKGFYQPRMMPSGAECVACPNEGVCEGSIKKTIFENDGGGDNSTASVIFENAPPHPKPDFFGFREDILAGSANASGYEPMLWPCPQGRCVGGPDFLCNEGWQGAMCSTCADGYFSVGVSCVKCVDNGGLYDALIFTTSSAFIITLWIGMNTVVAGGYDAFDITLIFLQVLSTVQSFQLKWPESLSSLSQASSLVNFDLDFVAPNCFTYWQYIHRATLTLVLPVLLVFVALMSSLWKTHKLLKEQTGRARGVMFSGEVLWHGIVFPSKFLLCGKRKDGGRLKLDYDRRKVLVAYIDNKISKLLSFLVVVYNNLCIKSFGSFHCVDRGVGKGSYLYQDPNITCWEDPEHFYLITISVIAFIIYVVTIPAGIAFTLRKFRSTNSLFKPGVINRLGFLYRRYETDRHLWEVTFLVRRAVVSIVYVFYGSSQPYIAMLWVMGWLGLNLSISSSYMPFKEGSIDLIDISSIMTVMLYLLAGVVADMKPEYSDGLGVLLNLIVWGLIVYCFLATMKESRGKMMTMKYARHIRKMMTEVRESFDDVPDDEKLDSTDPSLGPKLVQGKALWTYRMVCRSLSKAFKGLKEEGYVSVTLAQIAEWLKKRGERYVHPEHPCFYVLRQVIGIADIENLPVESSILALDGEMLKISVSESMFHEKKRMAGELSNTLKPDHLRALVDKLAKGGQESREAYTRFLTLAVSTQNILGDNCTVGDYSHYPEAILLKKLVRAIPALVDYALTCTEAEADALRTTFVGVCRLAMNRGTSGFLAPLCVEEDHGSMLYWLLLADNYDRQLLRVFLEDVEQESAQFTDREKKRSMREHRHGDGSKEYDIPALPYTTSSLNRSKYEEAENGVRNAGSGTEKPPVQGNAESKAGAQRTVTGLMTDVIDAGFDILQPRTVTVKGDRMPATRVPGHEQATGFRDNGFRIFKSSQKGDVERSNSARGLEDGFDLDGGEAHSAIETGIETGLKAGELDSYPVSFN